jgi:2-keto-4-pentenoate hydratase/2-oxohepta-3-ene-1,7-dioic acid hydratase in catechol pathway
MKVIGFTSNYGEHEETPRCYLMADSSILYTGRPFFLPDFANSFIAVPTLVVRTGRLGKCIAPKFAHRYWDAFTAGFTVHAVNSDDERLTVLDRAFDGALIVGEWVDAASCPNVLETMVQITVNGEVAASRCLSDMHHQLADLLAGVSMRCSIKMGDLLITGDAGEGHVLAAGDRLGASVDGHPVLDVKVRL